VCQENMANKVKMLEDKLSGSTAEDHAHETAPTSPAVTPAVPMATPYDQPYERATTANQPTQASPGPAAADDNETSFSDNRPPTSTSTYHGARPKTPAAKPDTVDERPDTRRSSMALPYIAE